MAWTLCLFDVHPITTKNPKLARHHVKRLCLTPKVNVPQAKLAWCVKDLRLTINDREKGVARPSSQKFRFG